MTFLEAAIEILRSAESPMHFSEVATRAVDDNLLSHVGRDPETAMRSCLNSAARAGHSGEEPVIVRHKPGFYGIRPGATLPDPPPRPDEKNGEKSKDSNEKHKVPPEVKKAPRSAAAKSESTDTPAGRGRNGRRRRGRTPRGEAPEPELVEVVTARRPVRKSADAQAASAPDADPIGPRTIGRSEPGEPVVEFEAPSGSGLEGVTDVALVMANAVSRLVVERPELKNELEAMQVRQTTEDPPAAAPGGSSSRRTPREPVPEERGGRRRRRRRRRGKRVEWSSASEARSAAAVTDQLLDHVAQVLEESGPRSLHVRQIAETLAGRGVLEGEISELERAATAAILLDVQRYGRASRFCARGDARYQLLGTRLPQTAAKAEQELRTAVRAVDAETNAQLAHWLQSLGARALEALVRIYLQREGYSLLSALPPGRGVGKLVVDDPDGDDEARLLVLVIPKRTAVDPKLWDGDLERNRCTGLVLFAMSEIAEEPDVRLVGAVELATWLRQQGLGVERVQLEVTVLDPVVIESIAGLDT